MIKKLIFATKIGLTLWLLSSVSHYLPTPIKIYNLETSSLYVNQMGESEKNILLDAQNQIKKTSWQSIEAEIKQEQIDKAHGVKINYEYVKNKMPNWNLTSGYLSNIEYNLKSMNEQTNHYLVPQYFSTYKLPQNLKNEPSFYIGKLSTLSMEATKNEEYLLNYYPNYTLDNIVAATTLSGGHQELNSTKLNQEFKENLKIYQDYIKNMPDEENLQYEDIKKSYDYTVHMNLDNFFSNTNDLNIVKNLINRDNSDAFVDSAIIHLVGSISIVFSLILGAVLPLIWNLDNWLLLLYISFKGAKLKNKEKKNLINYKQMHKIKPKKTFNLNQYFREKKYKNISLFALISSAFTIAGALSFYFFYNTSFSSILPVIFFSLHTAFIYSATRKEKLVEKLQKIQNRLDLLDSQSLNSEFIEAKDTSLNSKTHENEQAPNNYKQNSLNQKVLKSLG